MLQHSFLINWNDDKQKWVVECILLKVNIEADTYRDAIDKLTLKLLKHQFSSDFFNLIEKNRKDYSID